MAADADSSAGPTLVGARVRLRPWHDDDLAPFAAMNADPAVMRHFPATLTRAESDAMVGRARAAMAERGFGAWALEVPEIGFAGFVGLTRVPFEAPFSRLEAPAVEVGWRLCRAAWGQGYASEAARLALAHGFEVLARGEIVSFTTLANTPSIRVMQRIGMAPAGPFDNPRVPIGHPMRPHVLYRIERSRWRAPQT